MIGTVLPRPVGFFIDGFQISSAQLRDDRIVQGIRNRRTSFCVKTIVPDKACARRRLVPLFESPRTQSSHSAISQIVVQLDGLLQPDLRLLATSLKHSVSTGWTLKTGDAAPPFHRTAKSCISLNGLATKCVGPFQPLISPLSLNLERKINL